MRSSFLRRCALLSTAAIALVAAVPHANPAFAGAAQSVSQPAAAATPLVASATPRATTRPAATSTPAADPCPLHVVSFMEIAQGISGHVDRYVVGLLLDGTEPVSANLQIPGLENDVYTPVIGPELGGSQTLVHYVIDIPRAVAPRGVRVYGLLEHGRSDKALVCRSPARLLAMAPGSEGSFDDVSITGSDLLFLRSVTEAKVLRPASAAYPPSDQRTGHRGSTVVEVTVGPHGAILNALVFKSSGYQSLDAAALSAARQTEYSEPEFKGVAIPCDYLMTYSFGR